MCAAPKKAIVKKNLKSKVVAKNSCDGTVEEQQKILIMTVQTNLFCLLHVQDSPPNSSKLSLPLHATLDFISSFTMAFLGAAHFFYSLAVFGLDFTSLCALLSWHIVINGCCYLISFFFFMQTDICSRQIFAVLHMCIIHTFYIL